MDMSSDAPASFEDLMAVVRVLLDPGGCPWDRQQTHSSLRQYLLEECYETLEAIDAGDTDGLAEELGDLLIHVAFHADMARRNGEFEIADVFRKARSKLIRRHPHVFGGSEKLERAEQVVERWEALKRAERGGRRRSVADAVPAALPALAYAANLQHRTESAGIAWRGDRAAIDAPAEALAAIVRAAPEGAERERVAGELLFAVTAELRRAGVDPETALRRTALSFRDRLRRAEDAAENAALADLDADSRAAIWAAARAPAGRGERGGGSQ